METKKIVKASFPSTKQRLTKEHHKIMVEFMESHPDLARNKLNNAAGRDMSRILWERLAELLNSCGHLIRSPDAWKKDYKQHAMDKKRKLRLYRNGTGGGPETPPQECKLPPMTELEEKLIEIVNGELNIGGIPSTFRFGAATSVTIQKSPATNRSSTRFSLDISESNSSASQNSPVEGIENREMSSYNDESVQNTIHMPNYSKNTSTPRPRTTTRRNILQQEKKGIFTEVLSVYEKLLTSMSALQEISKRQAEAAEKSAEYQKRQADAMEEMLEIKRQKFMFLKRMEVKNDFPKENLLNY